MWSRRLWLGPLLAAMGSVLLLVSIFHEPGGSAFSPGKDNTDLPFECFNSTDPPAQLIFMLIDAWRYDFLASPESPMEFLRRQVDAGKAAMMRAMVQVPTVTQPRIKALTGGVNPSFASLLSNFFSSSMTTESWLSRAHAAGKRLVFYGDNTWEALFPPTYFADSLGVPSFNVLDYTQVDEQVTQRMRVQLQRDNWDIMILHYLGLDHIGHSLGGESEEIPKKLRQMDDIAQEMFLAERASRNRTIVILGDHGMTLQGSHGGSHVSETQTPVIVLSTETFPAQITRAAEVPTIQQVDVVSLVSYLLRQPLPASSVSVSVLPSLQKYWFLSTSQVIFDFLLHLRQWGSDDDSSSYLTTLLRRPNKSCSQLESAFDYHVLDEFYEKTRSRQKEILAQRQQIGGVIYNVGLAMLLAAAIFFASSTSFSDWNSLLAVLPVFCTASSSFVEEEHDVWYYCSCGAVFLFLWMSRRPSVVLKCLLILGLHRFASSASAGLRRRWTMDPDLLPSLLWTDAPFFQPVHSFGEWIQSSLFPSSESPLGGVYLLLLAALTKFDSVGPCSWLACLLQTSAAFCYLASWQSWLSSVIYLSSWCWMFLLWSSPRPAIILFISFITRPAFVPVLLSTYAIGRLSREVDLNQAATASLLTSSLFYTGLSNSISSIDIRAGYGGVLEYHPAVVGMQILANMYAPFLFFLTGFGKASIANKGLKHLILIRILMIVASASFLILFTEHLFIWTVFTPKVIFDIVHCFVVLSLYTCCSFRVYEKT